MHPLHHAGLSRRSAVPSIPVPSAPPVSVALVLGWVYWAWGPGLSLRQTANILVTDVKFGMRARAKAIGYGDAILPALERESNGYRKLTSRNSLWIADVLGGIRTERSRAVLTDLYRRPTALPHRVGAIGLAEQGRLPTPDGKDHVVTEAVESNRNSGLALLGIIALGRSRSEDALPILWVGLKQCPSEYSIDAYACIAVARIHSQSSVPVLEGALRSPCFYALPEAFRALVALGDTNAVPLAIARVGPGLRGYNAGFVTDELQKVTGQRFGYDRAKWAWWWQRAGSSWQIPAEFRKPFDEQAELN